MLIVLVNLKVKDEFLCEFQKACIENATASRKEPGIARFDVIQQQDDKTRFMLIEVYRSVEATKAHKENDHYKKWRDTVEKMMAEPRYSVKYTNVYPPDNEW